MYSIAALASVVMGLSVWQAWPGWQPGWQPALLVLFIALLHWAEINGRIRAATVSLAPTSVAGLVCVIYARPSAAVVYACMGALIGKWLFKRQPAIKAIFNASKETLAVAAAVVVAHGLGFVPVSLGPESRAVTPADIIAICAAAGIYALIEEVLAIPVLSIAGGLSMRHVVMANLDIRFVVRLGALAAAVVMYLILLQSDVLLLAMPVLVYGVHLATAMRIRTRSERETWQRLSRATDEFNSVDFDGVLRTAVLRAAELFSVHEVEVEVKQPPRLVRGDANDVLYDGPPSGAPTPTGQAITIDLTTSADVASLGELRLLIRGGQITLSERENYTLSTFAAALRSFLRQDPDIVMVGEIRDLETAQISIQASLTGHLVLSTLHTNDAAGAVTRLVDIGVEPFLIASSLEAVLAQRLVRRICTECRTAYDPGASLIQQLGLRGDDIGSRQFFYGKGCEVCHDTGYLGRLGIFEMMRMNDAMRDLVTSRSPTLPRSKRRA